MEWQLCSRFVFEVKMFKLDTFWQILNFKTKPLDVHLAVKEDSLHGRKIPTLNFHTWILEIFKAPWVGFLGCTTQIKINWVFSSCCGPNPLLIWIRDLTSNHQIMFSFFNVQMHNDPIMSGKKGTKNTY